MASSQTQVKRKKAYSRNYINMVNEFKNEFKNESKVSNLTVSNLR